MSCVESKLDQSEIYWAVTFLTRVVARGDLETEALVSLVQKLSVALNRGSGIPLTV